MNLDEIRDTLMSAVDQQLASDKAALQMNQTLGQQQIMYENDARGTLYSGLPTWQRASLATQGLQSLTKLNSNYAESKVKTWNSIADTLDRIRGLNEAAAALVSNKSQSQGQDATAMADAYYKYLAEQYGGTE